MPDFCSEGFVGLLVLYLLYKGVKLYFEYQEEKAAAELAAKQKAEEERRKAEEAAFLRDHPQAWLAREQAKLERERFEKAKALAESENSRNNVGLAAEIARRFLGG